MKIELHKITVRELVEGYVDDAESGVRGFGGRLDIRPAYKRAFGYEHTPSNSYRFVWTDAAINRDTNNLVTASIELFRGGGVCVTTKGAFTYPASTDEIGVLKITVSGSGTGSLVVGDVGSSADVVAQPQFHDVARPPRPCCKGEGALATSGFAAILAGLGEGNYV